MLDRKPEIGQVWEHFKGNQYKILWLTGVPATVDTIFDTIFLFSDTTVLHSELNCEVILCEHQGILHLTTNLSDDYLSKNDIILTPHIIYQNIITNQVWAKPLDSFMETVSTPYINGVADCFCYRFNRIS